MGWILMIIALIAILFLLLLGFSIGRAARRGDELMESALSELKQPDNDATDIDQKRDRE